MAITPVRPQDIDEVLSQQNGPLTKLYKVAAPFTTVVNRALVTDFSRDLLPKFGINRVMTQALQEVQGEAGPNGEQVFKPLNDIHDQVRMYGGAISENGVHGPNIEGQNLEIVFYGTGLNLLIQLDAGSRTLKTSIDGGTLSGELYPTGLSSVVAGRNYPSNQLFQAASGLALGLHTIRIASSNATIRFFGFEVLNATWQSPPGVSYIGGRKLSKPTLTTDSFNSVFESGTLGTKGGHVVVYQKPDGSVVKAVNPTDTTALYLSAATHANETIIHTRGLREYGAGRVDDFSYTNGTGINLAFTLDDGTTTLVGSNVLVQTSFGVDTVGGNTTGSFVTITFVGTGLDIVAAAASTTPDSHNVTIDGVSVGTLTTIPAANTYYTIKLCSGLPYGTHTVKITRSAAAVSAYFISRTIAYGTSKPTIPVGAVEVADYYVMANYAASTGSTNGPLSTGVLFKSPLREFVYSGTWSVGAFDTNMISGFDITTATANSYFEYTFFGSVVEFGGTGIGGTATLSVLIDGATPTTTVTPTNGTTYSAGVWSLIGGGQLQISGLTLGYHKIRVTLTNAFTFNLSFVSVATPIHSPKSNAPGDLQATLSVGNQAIGDSRKFALQSVKALSNWAQAVGVTSGPTTTSTSFVPMPDEISTIRTFGNPIEISYASTSTNSAAGNANAFVVYVDGVQASSGQSGTAPVANYQFCCAESLIIPVAAGLHTIQLYWATAAGTATAITTRRILKVREI